MQIQSIAPDFAQAGSPDLVLAVAGSGFVQNAMMSSWVSWRVNDVEHPLETKFVDAGRVTAVVPAALLAAPGPALVTVHAGDPEGERVAQTSNTITFLVHATTGAIGLTAISPTGAQTGGGDLVLTLTGTGFITGFPRQTWAEWEFRNVQTALRTTFVNSTTLTAVVPASLVTTPGTAGVYVRTGDPMNDETPPRSNIINFTITER